MAIGQTNTTRYISEQFDLLLWNRRLNSWLGVPALLTALLSVLAIWEWVLHQAGGKWGPILLGVPTFLGCFYGLERLTCRAARVELTGEGLRVLYGATNKETQVAWADVAAYREAPLNGGREVRFWLRAGRQVALSVNTTQGNMMEYFRLIRTITQATATYNDLHPGAITRRSNLLAETVIKVGLVLIAVLLLLLTLKSCNS